MAHLDSAIFPELDTVRRALARLREIMPPSRTILCHELSTSPNAQVHLKLELENPTGSFKVRGAFTVLSLMSESDRRGGVVASSAGNHGLGVAYAARHFGAPAVLFLPRTAPEVKKAGIKAAGAQVNDEAADYDAAMELAIAYAHDNGVRFINPCLGVDLLAGQGTVALELLDQVPDARAVVVSVGGGGLLGGIGAVLRRLAPDVRIVGVQSEETSAMTRSVLAGKVVHTPVTPTLADGLAGQIDSDALTIGQQCADELVLVTEDEIAETMLWFRSTLALKVEGAGAVSTAALRHGKLANAAGPVVAIVTGGNVDDSRFEQIKTRMQQRPTG